MLAGMIGAGVMVAVIVFFSYYNDAGIWICVYKSLF